VDSIRYSNSSERFISGSKDGTARIWRNVKNSWFSLSLSMKPLSGYNYYYYYYYYHYC